MYKSFKKECDDSSEKPKIPSPKSSETNESLSSSSSEHRSTIDECWRQIDRQIERRRRLDGDRDRGQSRDRGWKIVRVFVSSTFNDYHNEREVLVKKVFPELSEWLKLRQMVLVECDLRWGVPKDSNTDTTVLACLEEVERCYHDNDGHPFVVNLTGERYGWIPDVSALSEDIQRRFDWIPNLSITAMEIVRGALLPASRNAAFFFRRMRGTVPESERSKFVDTDSLQVEHLKRHKEELAKRCPGQTFHYEAIVKGLEVDTAGRNMLVFDNLDEFAIKVGTYLRCAVESFYPTRVEEVVMSPEKRETQSHWYYATEKCAQFEGREKELANVMDFANGQSKDSSTILAVTAEEGYGKSTLMAEVTQHLVDAAEHEVFYHFVGKDWNSAHVSNLLRRLNQQLKQDADEDLTEQSDYAILEKTWFERLNRARSKRLVVIVDALNELDNANSTNALTWLPSATERPPEVAIVVSYIGTHAPTAARLEERRTGAVRLGPFDRQTSEVMCTNYFKNYAKTLDAQQLEALIAQNGASHPLWLWTACDEIRVYGDFATLTHKIQNLGQDIATLLSNILDRLLAEDEEQLVEKTLSLLVCTRDGLSQPGLCALLTDDDERPLPPLLWSQTRIRLTSFIKYRLDGDLIWALGHGVVRKVVKEKLLNNDETLKKYNGKLASYYDQEIHGARPQGRPYGNADRANIANFQHHLMRAIEFDKLLNFYWNDRLSMMVPHYQRRQHTEQLRCRMSPTNNSAVPKFCTFCRHKLDRKCYICAAFPGDRPALWCQWHQPMVKSQTACVLCKKVLPEKMLAGDVKLCAFCSTHNKCCFLRTNDRGLQNELMRVWRAQ